MTLVSNTLDKYVNRRTLMSEIIDKISGRVIPSVSHLRSEVAANSGQSYRIQTVNLHHLHLALVNAEFRRALLDADGFTADGWPVRQAIARRVSTVQRVTGADYVFTLIGASTEHLRIALIGAEASAGNTVEAELVAAGHVVVYRNHGRWADWNVGQLALDLATSKPDLTLIAVTPPNGELTAAQLRDHAAPGVIIGVGGAVDMLAGTRRKSPRLINALHAEWAFRLVQEPRRLVKRYLIECLPTWVLYVLPLAWKGGKR